MDWLAKAEFREALAANRRDVDNLLGSTSSMDRMVDRLELNSKYRGLPVKMGGLPKSPAGKSQVKGIPKGEETRLQTAHRIVQPMNQAQLNKLGNNANPDPNVGTPPEAEHLGDKPTKPPQEQKPSITTGKVKPILPSVEIKETKRTDVK